jgi:hypothetical protein
VRASFALLHAAVHIEDDQDFSGSRERLQPRSKVNSPKQG